MPQAIYLTHPEVEIDPKVPVPDWGLNDIGAGRVAALAPKFRGKSWHVVTSAERKALETAWPIAAALETPVEVRKHTHENDRSATGFLPGSEFEEVADAFFANPTESIRGWERAIDAQTRIVAEVNAVLDKQTSKNVLFCGHGGVGTLLYCAFAQRKISRMSDQNGAGHWFSFDTQLRTPQTHWRPMEELNPI